MPTAQSKKIPDSSLQHRVGSDKPFYVILTVIGGFYLLMIVLMLMADMAYTSSGEMWAAFAKPEIRASIRLSLVSCTMTAVLSLFVAVPIAYLMSRHRFWGGILSTPCWTFRSCCRRWWLGSAY